MSGVVLGVASEFYKPISDTIWLTNCVCDRFYVSLTTFSMLNYRKSLISPSAVISNPSSLMSDTIFLSSYLSGPSVIESPVNSIYTLFSDRTHINQSCFTKTQLLNWLIFTLGTYSILYLPDSASIYSSRN